MAFKDGAGVLEVLFGVGFGGGDAVKCFVENANDPLLFGERWNVNFICLILLCNIWLPCRILFAPVLFLHQQE